MGPRHQSSILDPKADSESIIQARIGCAGSLLREIEIVRTNSHVERELGTVRTKSHVES